MMENSLETLVSKAVEGDKASLNALLGAVQHFVYGISLKLLHDPENAKDATQEILLKVLTHLSSFQGQSTFKTWVYRVAINYLVNLLTREKRRALAFSTFAQDLADGLRHDADENASERQLWVEEAKIGCSMGMLQCLDVESRVTYVLGAILEINSVEGAFIQDITPAAFRQRLSRAKSRINAFVKQNCGLVRATNACRCHKKVDDAIQKGRIDPHHLKYASDVLISSIVQVEDAAALIQSNPAFAFPADRLQELKRVIEGTFA